MQEKSKLKNKNFSFTWTCSVFGEMFFKLLTLCTSFYHTTNAFLLQHSNNTTYSQTNESFYRAKKTAFTDEFQMNKNIIIFWEM